MKKLFVSPWKSTTPRALSRHLGSRLVRLSSLDGSEATDLLLNWGCADLRSVRAKVILNHPGQVKYACNKALTFSTLSSNKVPTLENTTNREIALDWNRKSSVIAHIDPHGHSGHGLKRVEPDHRSDMPYCPLYTKFFPKTREMRVLIIRKEDTDYETMFLEKKKILPERYAEFGLEGKPDWFIRTHENGWIYAREVEELPLAILHAKTTMRVLGLHYGAVDLMAKMEGTEWDVKVGEINSAPGLQGQALDFFKTGLTRLAKQALGA